MDHEIIRDHATSRSRGFGFIVFDSEKTVDELLAKKGNMIDLAGTQVSLIHYLVKSLKPILSYLSFYRIIYKSRSKHCTVHFVMWLVPRLLLTLNSQ